MVLKIPPGVCSRFFDMLRFLRYSHPKFNQTNLKYFILVFSYFISFASLAQWNEKELQPISLENLDFFKPVAGNWKIESKATCLWKVNQNLETSPGKGVLVNRPDAVKKDNLFSNEEFSDLDFQFDFMMPRGSNSGIYLMGRYEIQLFDSWGKENPTFADCGGVYQRWVSQRGKGSEGFEGVAPFINACLAPGLWQTMKISFEAPRFSPEGIKIRNARFTHVWLNGVKIHSNVEVSGPTRGAAFDTESVKGPIMIQGDHGPVAIRNMMIAPYGNPPLRWNSLNYAVYQGIFTTVQEYSKHEPVRSGKSIGFDKSDAGSDDDFLLAYKGDLEVQTAGKYKFFLEVGGNSILKIDGNILLDTVNGGIWFQKREVETDLSKGSHPFELYYLKKNPKTKPVLGLTYSGPGIKSKKLHSESSLNSTLPGGQMNLPLEIHPFIQRSFVFHKGIKKAYCLNVCTPQGIHYSLNINTGRLIRVWKGKTFGDVQTMWNDRGSIQALYPSGAVVELPDGALVGSGLVGDSYPDTLTDETTFKYLGYSEKIGETPLFRYKCFGGEIEFHYVPIPNGLKTNIRFRSTPTLWHCIAEGKTIEKASDGSYKVDDSYFIEVEKDTESLLKIMTKEKVQRLIVPLSSKLNNLNYSILW